MLENKIITQPLTNQPNKEVKKMPRGDGTGPTGAGPGTGRGRGAGQGRRGGGGIGIGGNCVCPSCDAIVTHQVGIPCSSIKCPKCGAMMIRQ